MPVTFCSRVRRLLRAARFGAGDQGARNSLSLGSVVNDCCSSVSPDTPSTSAWCIFV